MKIGDKIQFRKSGGWYNEQGEWRTGKLKDESKKCFFIEDLSGDVKEYWKHRIEIRQAVEVRGFDPSKEGFKC